MNISTIFFVDSSSKLKPLLIRANFHHIFSFQFVSMLLNSSFSCHPNNILWHSKKSDSVLKHERWKLLWWGSKRTNICFLSADLKKVYSLFRFVPAPNLLTLDVKTFQVQFHFHKRSTEEISRHSYTANLSSCWLTII